MTEPTNPLFDHEKEFLERKKLEYERALRGDVEEIKEQTVHVGKLALVGTGVVGGIWLLAKAFGGGKAKAKNKKKNKHKYKPQPASFEDYAGFDGYGDEDDHDQELEYMADSYQSPEYAYDHADHFEEDEDDDFYAEGAGEDDNRVQYEFGEPGELTADSDADDNGLSSYPNFPAHSSPKHGDEAEAPYASGRLDQGPADVYHTDEDHGYDEGPAHSFASEHSYQARPYDDSRRLPESNSFADFDEEPAQSQATPSHPKRLLMPTLLAFAKTETGKMLIAEATAVGMALVGKKIQDIMLGNAAKTSKNDDLAASSVVADLSPAARPVTTAAQDVSAAALQDDTLSASLSAREPLA